MHRQYGVTNELRSTDAAADKPRKPNRSAEIASLNAVYDNLLSLWLAALPLMGGPGPVTLSMAAIGSTYGVKRGLLYYTGVCLGTSTVLIVIATGITSMILLVPGLTTLITLLAAGYILYLAWRIATAPLASGDQQDSCAPSLISGYLFAIANPKAYAAIGAIYSSQTVVADDLSLDTAIKISALLLVIYSVNAIWLASGELLSALLRGDTTGRVINIVFALLLVLSVWPTLSRL